jgi:ribosome-binding factor A
MSILEEKKRSIRGELGHKVAKQLRIVPEINFYLDSTLDYVDHLDSLLKG